MTDKAQLQRLAAMWKSKLDWPFEVADGAFRDPDGRLGLVFGVTPTKALSFGKGEPYSQTPLPLHGLIEVRVEPDEDRRCWWGSRAEARPAR